MFEENSIVFWRTFKKANQIASLFHLYKWDDIQNSGKASIGISCRDMGNNDKSRNETHGECEENAEVDVWSQEER